MHASTLRLTLLGKVELHRMDGVAVDRPLPLCPQTRNLIAYLALAKGKGVSRDELCEALRDEAARPARAGAFNTALWRLRHTLAEGDVPAEDVLFKRRDGCIGIRVDAPLTIDVASYLSLLLPALELPPDALDASTVERLRTGVALYKGELLPGVHDDWILRERERLRRHQLNALGRLVQASVRAGDIDGGIGFAQRIVEIDELREDAHRDLMRLHMLAGQRALALRQYETCRQILRRELSIVPMPQTQALYQEIADSAVARRNGDAVPLAQASQEVDALLAAARQHLAAADAEIVRAMRKR